jgi:flagellin
MTSILTNAAAMAALQTLRSLDSNLATTQGRVSFGMRVQSASDNAAYWSISTTMRSDRMAISAVSDALGLGAAKVDTAYAGMNAVVDVLHEFKAKLVAATEDGIDKAKVQTELEQLKEQVVSISTSASFSGQNWLNTSIADIHDNTANTASVVSSFVRSASGAVAVTTADIHLSKTALFNSTGNGLLEADNRLINSIGGMRLEQPISASEIGWSSSNTRRGEIAFQNFNFSGPITFASPSDAIEFDMIVDSDDPSTGISPPYHPGKITHVVIDRAFVDSVNPSWGGVIDDYVQFKEILNRALYPAGAKAVVYRNYDNTPIIDKIGLWTLEYSGLDGSHVGVSGLSSNVGTGGLSDFSAFGKRSPPLDLMFQPFTVFPDGSLPGGIQVSFGFRVNDAPSKSYSFDREYVNNLFGKDNGKVETADEMVTLLQSLIQADWPSLVIESNSPSNVSIYSDPLIDRRSGNQTRIGFTGIDVSNEPVPTMSFLGIDIEQNPDMVDSYLSYIERVTANVVDGAATLGALSKRIELQTEFAERMMATVDRGIGRLVDADMNLESTRLKALQAQQQLAIQSLQIANTASEHIAQLFR